MWDYSKLRENVKVGSGSVIGQGCYIDKGVVVGDNCKIQNNAQIFSPSRLEDGVFVGPGVIFTNDKNPRAVDVNSRLKGDSDWQASGVVVQHGASIGAGAICVGPITVGTWSMVAAGAVVTRDVPAFALVAGAPAVQVGWVSRAGFRLAPSGTQLICPESGEKYEQSRSGLELVKA